MKVIAAALAALALLAGCKVDHDMSAYCHAHPNNVRACPDGANTK